MKLEIKIAKEPREKTLVGIFMMFNVFAFLLLWLFELLPIWTFWVYMIITFIIYHLCKLKIKIL